MGGWVRMEGWSDLDPRGGWNLEEGYEALSRLSGHWTLGYLSMTELVSHSYWRQNLPKYMKQYVQGCHTCRRAKHRNQHKLGKLQLIPTPNGPWQWIQSDFMGELAMIPLFFLYFSFIFLCATPFCCSCYTPLHH